MNYSEYVKGISFRFYRPQMRPWLYKIFSRLLRKFGYSLEILNTRLPGDDHEMRDRLIEICKIPRMSTYAIAAMINKGVSQMPAGHCFVNIGVWHGFTLLAGMMKNPDKKCIGVDNFSEFGGPREIFNARFKHYKSSNHHFFDMDYEEYFATVHKEPIGFYIYDGEHSYENQLKGLRTAEPFFAKNCIILVDDTNLKTSRWALDDFLAQSTNKYEILLDQATPYSMHPALWNGIVVLQKC
jgi:hypothetical protein